MLDKLASVFGSGVSEALDSLKKIAIDTWHIDPAKAAEIDLKKQEIEQAAIAKVMDQTTELARVNAADRASAREREAAVKDHTPKVLAYSVTAGFFSITWYMMINTVPVESQHILDMLFGSLLTAWIGIITYYFGSSAGSAAKHQMIDRMTK